MDKDTRAVGLRHKCSGITTQVQWIKTHVQWIEQVQWEVSALDPAEVSWQNNDR